MRFKHDTIALATILWVGLMVGCVAIGEMTNEWIGCGSLVVACVWLEATEIKRTAPQRLARARIRARLNNPSQHRAAFVERRLAKLEETP